MFFYLFVSTDVHTPVWLQSGDVLSLDPIQLRVSSPVVSSTTVTISFDSSAPTQCQMDESAFSPCTSPYQHINLESGEHTVTIKATDSVGCVKQNSVTFQIGGILCRFMCNSCSLVILMIYRIGTS